MSDYGTAQRQYIESVDGSAHITAVEIIGKLEAERDAKQFVIDMTLDEQARLRAEVGMLRRALTTLEGTLAAEIANCRTLIDERDAALQRAGETR